MKFYIVLLMIFGLSQNATAKSNIINAAFFKTDITLNVGEPLGGYFERNRFIFNGKSAEFNKFTLFKPSTGKLDNNYARGMVLKNQDNKKILFLSVDTIALDDKFYKDLTKKISYLGFNESNIVAIASHTHSGPGTLSKNFMWQFFAMGFYNSNNYSKIIQNIHDQIVISEQNYEAGRLEEFSFRPDNIQINRRTYTDISKKAQIILVRKKNSRKILGGLVNYSLHGTAHSYKNLKFSSDAPGGIVGLLESKLSKAQLKSSPVFLFANGASGDVGPKHSHTEGIKTMSQNFYRSFRRNLWRSKPAPNTWSYATTYVKLNKPSVDTEKCLNIESIEKTNSYTDLLDFIIPLPGFFLPRETAISRLDFAGKTFLLWPGEPTSSVGKSLTNLKYKKEILILSMANNYLGYFTSEDEYNEGGYEACTSFYNFVGTNILTKKFTELTLRTKEP